MSDKYRFEYVCYIVCPDEGTGSVRFRNEVLVADATSVSWSGGELRATTPKSDKRVRFGNDGKVEVEDVVSDPGRAMSRGELSAVAHQVDDFFGGNHGASR